MNRCHRCGGGLDSSPSVDFCSEDCQRSWMTARVGYDEEQERRCRVLRSHIDEIMRVDRSRRLWYGLSLFDVSPPVR